MLAAEDLTFSYGEQSKVLNGLSLHVKAGEIVSLLGPSGCGKSTVLRILANLLTPDAGNIDWQSNPNIAFVFQDAALMPWATVQRNVELPGRLKHNLDRDAVHAAIDAVNLTDFKDRYPAMLSGGQRMRVSVARALAASPSVLLMDEPFAALDEMLRFQMTDLLLQLVRERNLTVLFVTHSLFEAAYLSDRVLVMSQGCLVGEVTPSLDRSIDPDEQRRSSRFIEAVAEVGHLMRKSLS